jgi:hypothetical protein
MVKISSAAVKKNIVKRGFKLWCWSDSSNGYTFGYKTTDDNVVRNDWKKAFHMT